MFFLLGFLAAFPVINMSIADTSFRSARYNEVYRTATHNSYWVKRDNAVEAFASGTQERILDQLLFDHVRALEIDVHRDDTRPHDWTVYHTDKQSNSFCTPLSECLKQLQLFHHALPQHEVVTVVIELKEIFNSNFDSMHTPADLDRIIESYLGPYLYRPSDFLAKCPGNVTMKECARPEMGGWPTIQDLRGKFIFTVLGNWRWCTVGHGASGWATYASWGGGVRERSAFPMASDFTQFNGPECGSEPIPANELKAAQDASVFLQVEIVGDPNHMQDVKQQLQEGVVVRGHDSYSIPDQAARVAAGFQMIQTDYPWLQYNDLGAAQPFRPLREDATLDPNQFYEPGNRLMLSRPPSMKERVFSSQFVVNSQVEWETIPSTTRESPDSAYPNSRIPQGKGCLRAATEGAGVDDSQLQSINICRETAQGKWNVSKPLGEDAIITVETNHWGKKQNKVFYSSANGSNGIGDLIRMFVTTDAQGSTCVVAYSASEVAANGVPAWKALTTECYDRPLHYQGLAAERGDVLFSGTRKKIWNATPRPSPLLQLAARKRVSPQ